MSDAQRLSDDFDEKFADITARLRDRLTWKQYSELLHDFRDKKLGRATRQIEFVTKQHDRSISKTALALLRKYAPTKDAFYRDVDLIIDGFEEYMAIIFDWNDLMERNGGPKRAGKLAKKRGTELPAAPLPASFAG